MTDRSRCLVLLSLFFTTSLRTTWSAESSPRSTDTTSTAETPENSHEDHGLDKRASYFIPEDKRGTLGFHGMRGKKDFEALDDVYPVEVPHVDWEKRSLGFHGMRGKKWYEDDEILKRAAMGFQGMRGKKWNNDGPKRAMGFQGMRGKKAVMGFHGMRGKKDEEEDQYVPEYYFYNDEDKRGISGFQGMRGKKDDDVMKRAAMGFQGMRGKKNYEDEEDDMEKRAMGFQGMRGKKDDDYFLDSEMDKRAMGFHGMRGKKLTDYGFKRAMGFLGMRGKKLDGDWESEKRAPQQFFGMRGKKDDEEGGELNGLVTYLKETSPALDRARRSVILGSSESDKSSIFETQGLTSFSTGVKPGQ